MLKALKSWKATQQECIAEGAGGYLFGGYCRPVAA
jgi:hypothetical protein